MKNTYSYFVNGQLVYVPEDELDEFIANCDSLGYSYEEGEVYNAQNANGDVQEFTVPKSQSESFMAKAEASGGSARPMTMLTMDDGNRLTLNDDDISNFVQARATGQHMSRGLLKSVGIPELYGKSVEDREKLADALSEMFGESVIPGVADMQEQQPEDAATGGNVIAETAAPENMGLLPLDPTNPNGLIKPEDVLKYGTKDENLGDRLMRGIDAAGRWMDEGSQSGEFLPMAAKGLVGTAGRVARGFTDTAANSLRAVGADKAAGMPQALSDALPTDLPDYGNEYLNKAANVVADAGATAIKYGAAPAMVAADAFANGVNTFVDTYKKAEANGIDPQKAIALATARSGLRVADVLTDASAIKSLGNGAVKRIVANTALGAAFDFAGDVVEQGAEGADNPDPKRAAKYAAEGIPQQLVMGALGAAAGAVSRGNAARNERKQAEERAEEANRQIARDEARTRYEASLSDEARADIERNVNEMVKSEVIPSYRQAEEVAKRAAEKLTLETGESAEAVQQAVMEAAQEVSERLQTPSRVETPSLERRQTEAEMRNNERLVRSGEKMAEEIVNPPVERAPSDAEALSYVRAGRQSDLDAAFADYDAYLAKAEAARKRGSPATADTPEAIRDAVRGDAELQRIDAEYRKAKTQEERDALAEQFKARVAELTKNGEEPAKTDTEPQKLTKELSENDFDESNPDSWLREYVDEKRFAELKKANPNEESIGVNSTASYLASENTKADAGRIWKAARWYEAEKERLSEKGVSLVDFQDKYQGNLDAIEQAMTSPSAPKLPATSSADALARQNDAPTAPDPYETWRQKHGRRDSKKARSDYLKDFAETPSIAPTDALASASNLLKEKFYQDAASLEKQLRSLPPQAPAELRAAYETAIAEAKRRDAKPNDVTSDESHGGKFRGDVQLDVSNTTTAAKVADPEFTAWADSHKLAHTAENRRTYDTEQMKALLPALKQYRPGTKVIMHENGAEVPDGARKFISTDGNVVGYYDKTSQEAHLFPGASVGTVGHELVAHGLWDFAETQANNGNATLINKLESLANTAPAAIVNEVTNKYQNNPAFAQLSPRELMEEIFAARLTAESINKIKDVAKRREASKWLGKVKNALADTAKSMMTKSGFNKIDLDGISAMNAQDTMKFIVDKAMKGKSLATAERKGKVDMDAPIDIKYDAADRHGAVDNAVAYHKMYLKDHLAPLQRADKMAGVDNDSSVWSAMTLLPGKVEAAYREAQLQLKNTERECKKRGISMADANEYIKLLAERERTSRLAANGVHNGAGKNRAPADISRDIDALRRKYNQADLDFIQKSWMDFQARGMDERVAGEVIDMDYRAKLETAEPNHAPLKNRFDEAGDFTGFEDNGSVASPEWHEAKGRTDTADGPMQWMMRERVDAALRAQTNVARQRLLAEVQANPEMGTVKRLAPGETSKEMPRKGSQAGKDANTVAVKVVEVDPSTGEQSTVTYDIKLRGELGKQMAEALTGRDIMRMSELPGIWGKIGGDIKTLHRHWAGAATEYSFTFSGRNAVSDTLEVLFNNIGESAGKTRIKIEDALGGQSNNAAVRKTAKALSYVLGGPAGAVTGTWRDVKHVANMIRLIPAVSEYSWTGKTNNRTVNEMVKAGGLIGGGVRGQEVAQSVIDSVERDFKSGKNKVVSIVKNTLKPISVLNQTAEMLNRVADYATERGEGKSPESAAIHERKATVDFNEVGRITDLTNTYKMFSNSVLGSLYRTNESMFKNKNTGKFDPTGAVAMSLVGLAYGMMEAYNEDRMNGDDDAGKRMSDYDRKSALYIRKGDDIYRLPIHQGTTFSMLKNAGNGAYRYMKGKTSSDKIQNEIAKGTASLICQLAGLGDPSATVMQTLAPSLTQWMVEEAQNKDFANRDIEKTTFDKEKPKSHNGRGSTPSVFKAAAEWMNDTLGEGNEARKGELIGFSTDVSPEMLQHFYRSVTKNAGRDLENTAETIKMVMTAFGYGNTEADTKNMPFVRDYFRKASGGDSSYYEAKNEYEKDWYEYRNRYAKMSDAERKSYADAHPWVKQSELVNWIIDRIDDLRHYENSEVKVGRGFVKAKEPFAKERIEKDKSERLRLQATLLKIMGR